MIGLHGKKFKMVKFRTMLRNYNLREELNSLNKKSGPLFKIEDDPRLLKGLGFSENIVLMNFHSYSMY